MSFNVRDSFFTRNQSVKCFREESTSSPVMPRVAKTPENKVTFLLSLCYCFWCLVECNIRTEKVILLAAVHLSYMRRTQSRSTAALLLFLYSTNWSSKKTRLLGILKAEWQFSSWKQCRVMPEVVTLRAFFLLFRSLLSIELIKIVLSGPSVASMKNIT